MDLTVEHAQARVPVAIIRVQGDLDGSNYRQVIERAQQLHQAGARHLLVDLSGTSFMSSAGLVALHNIALLYRGSEPPDPEYGWRAIRAMGDSAEAERQPYVKLLNPQPRVTSVLEQTGLSTFFETHTDQAAALASF
jgi:anti-anti-sigma regulatory factor